jgi:hypothetical protein
MRNILFIFILSIPIAVFSQEGGTICDTSSAHIDKMLGAKILARTFVNTLVSNNNQFYNNWAEGDIILSDENVIKNELLRYNSYIDEFLWLRKTDFSAGIIYKSTVREFTIYNEDKTTIARFKNLKVRNWYALDSSYTYLQVLAEGRLSLYVQRRMVNIDKSSKELVQKDLYYLYKDGQFHSFVPNRMNLYRVMKVEKENMRKIIRSSHLRIRKEAQLTEAIKKYNAEFGNR